MGNYHDRAIKALKKDDTRKLKRVLKSYAANQEDLKWLDRTFDYDSKFRTILVMAAELSANECFLYLVDARGADINYICLNGQSAFSSVLNTNNQFLIRYIISHHKFEPFVSFSKTAVIDTPPIHMAIKKRNKLAIKLLLERIFNDRNLQQLEVIDFYRKNAYDYANEFCMIDYLNEFLKTYNPYK